MIRGLLRAEWMKLRSVRWTYAALGVAALLAIGLGVLDTFSVAHHRATMTAADRAGFDAVSETFNGGQLGQLAFGVLLISSVPVRADTGEPGTGWPAPARGGRDAAMFALTFLAWPVARALESWSYLPDHLLLANAADVLTRATPPGGPHAARLPSMGIAWLDLALDLVVFLALGAWRTTRDP
ncbi:hypothetical protein NE236_03935 [Actinoallomurus purpureus]|uniref:hypothetical protein n=1 Tax=Actinoallomurus purpureus TaxID=478114 RepID=UPI002092EF7D|nr:hypothetical protein [Actinoallomurus purpureus]MCO6004121.1 hypothetical protein [Actinoallomurus purpureus]